MIQLSHSLSTQYIWFTCLDDVDKILCSFDFVNLTSNQTFSALRTVQKEGDWYKADIVGSIKSWPLGMYIVTITNQGADKVVSRRLAYVAYNLSTPIPTPLEEYTTTNQNIVYEG